MRNLTVITVAAVLAAGGAACTGGHHSAGAHGSHASKDGTARPSGLDASTGGSSATKTTPKPTGRSGTGTSLGSLPPGGRDGYTPALPADGSYVYDYRDTTDSGDHAAGVRTEHVTHAGTSWEFIDTAFDTTYTVQLAGGNLVETSEHKVSDRGTGTCQWHPPLLRFPGGGQTEWSSTSNCSDLNFTKHESFRITATTMATVLGKPVHLVTISGKTTTPDGSVALTYTWAVELGVFVQRTTDVTQAQTTVHEVETLRQ